MIRFILYIFFLITSINTIVFGENLKIPLGLTHDETIKLGERIYREGILSSGESAVAIVQNDITVEGPMLTCAHCHLKSGLGGYEGKVYTPSINAERLFKPRLLGPERKLMPVEKLPKWFKYGMARPAYNDESLMKAIKYGEDSMGRILSPTMPRYILDDKDMSILIYYLRHLNANQSPGVDDYYIKFATVITEEVPDDLKESMLQSLFTIVKANNAQTRHQEKRAKKGPWTEENMNFFYRKYELYVWELKGSPDTWYNQLKKYYKEFPVFALIGGISTKSWEPIHRFCEDFKIPNIFPITHLPVISENDWYTLYFSKGFYQEGELVAKYLKNLSLDAENILIIYENKDASKMLLRGFVDKWEKFGGKYRLIEIDKLKYKELIDLIGSDIYRAVLLWVTEEDFFNLIKGVKLLNNVMLFASSTLIGENFKKLPNHLKNNVYFTYPYSIDNVENDKLIEKWLHFMKVNAKRKDIVAKVYTIGNVLTDTLMMLKGNFYRDYFLDVIDMQKDRIKPFTNYDRLSFGQGQRYASKGGYVVKVAPDGSLINQNEWIIF